MAVVVEQFVDTEQEQQRRGQPLQGLEGNKARAQQHQHRGDRDGEGMTRGDGQQGQPDHLLTLLLQPQRQRKQPAHPGIEPVKRAKAEHCQPRCGGG